MDKIYCSVIAEMIEAFALFEFSFSSELSESSFTLIDANRALYSLLHSDSASVLGSNLQVFTLYDPHLPSTVLGNIPLNIGQSRDLMCPYHVRLLRPSPDHLACFITI